MAKDDLDGYQIFREAVANIKVNLEITMFSNGIDSMEAL